MNTRLFRRIATGIASGLSAALHLLGAQVPGELRGRVIDAATGSAIAGAQIEMIGRPESGRSGAQGEFIRRGLEPRDYTVRARAVGYAARDIATTIINGRATTLDIALEPVPTDLGAILVRAARDPQATQAVSFDRAMIERSGHRDLGELLQTTPGVVITQAGGAGAATHVSIRGSSASEVLVLLDGVPLNSMTSGDVDLSRIALESVERVTVLTGAQAARYGARALAGVIEIETRRSRGEVSTLLRTGAWGEREASGALSRLRRAGARQIGGSLTGDYRTVRGDFPFQLPAFRGGGTARRINSDVLSRQALGALTLDDARGSARLRGSWEDLSRGLAGSIVQPSTTGRESSTRSSAGVDARRQIGPLAWTALADISHERTTFADSAPPFGTAYDDTVTATGLTATVTGTVGTDVSSGSVGGEMRTLDVASTMLAPGAPHWQRVLGVFGSYRASRFIEAARMTIAVDVGARIDNSSLEAGSAFSPGIGATVSRGVLSASASIANGYAPPTLGDQFFHEGVLVRANPALRPERTKGDIEGRLALRRADMGVVVLSASAAAYRANIDGMILWLPDFRFIWSPSNFQVRRTGFDLSGSASIPAPNIELQGTFNHTDVTYDGSALGGQVAYRPQTTASVGVALTPYRGRLEITERYVGERRTVPGSPLNTLDPYWLADARWMSSLTSGRLSLDVTLGLENLFDRPAAMLVDYPFPGRTWTISLRARHSP